LHSQFKHNYIILYTFNQEIVYNFVIFVLHSGAFVFLSGFVMMRVNPADFIRMGKLKVEIDEYG